jgi:hypothetical protein
MPEMTWEPDKALLPVQPVPPDALQETVLAELQLRVEEAPEANEVGLAVMEAVGGLALVVTPRAVAEATVFSLAGVALS